MPSLSSLAIVGGGLSGTLVVLNLLRACQKPLQIQWFDAQGKFGKGLAYSTPHDYHLLNVRAAGMSLYADEPAHFTNWLQGHAPRFGATDFVPRPVFARYVQSELQRLTAQHPHIQINRIAAEVNEAKTSGGGFTLKTATASYTVEELVLALGNFPPAFPSSPDQSYRRSANYLHECFDEAGLEPLLQKKSLVILGSGLTMIDVVLSLYHQGFQGELTILSPHGYLPQAHAQSAAGPATQPGPGPGLGLQQVLAWVNAELRLAKAEGKEPLSVIDRLRPFTQGYWLGFSDAEKQQFLRHLRHKWGVARHRAPAPGLELLNQWLARGRARIIKGRLRQIAETPGGFKLDYLDGQGKTAYLDTEGLINCTGPGSDYNKLDQPLVKQMLTLGQIAPDAIRYGLQASPDGQIGPKLHTLGPPLKGILWESTAIPEIRLQARDLALKIIRD